MSAPRLPLSVEKHRRSRFWAVRDRDGALVVVAAYRCGAENVARLLAVAELLPDQFHRTTV